MDANIRFDHQLLAVESEHAVHCMLELDIPAAVLDERAPLRLALVIDRSGSMAGPSLDVAKNCAEFLARHLQPTDELAVVTYDDEVALILPLAGMLLLSRADSMRFDKLYPLWVFFTCVAFGLWLASPRRRGTGVSSAGHGL